MAISNGGVIITLLSVFKAKHHCEWLPSFRVVSKTSFIETSCLIYFFFHFTLHTTCKGRKKKKGKKALKALFVSIYSFFYIFFSEISSLQILQVAFKSL